MSTPCTCDTFNTEVAVVPSGFGGSAGTGAGNVDVAGSVASLNVWRRTLTAFPSSPAAGDRYALYSPDGTLRIFTSAVGDLVTVTASGQMGIGTTSPTQKLSVAGTISYNSGSSGAVGLVNNDNHFIRSNGLGAQVFANNWGSAAQGWIFRDEANAVDRVVIQGNGLVGIGTDSPQQALDVAGTVRTTGVLLGGDMLLSGGIKDSTGQNTRVDYNGCYYVS